MRNALNFRLGIAHGVKSFFRTGEVPVYCNSSAAWLTKVNVAGELANDQNVQP